MTGWRCVRCWTCLYLDPCSSPLFCRTCRWEMIHRVRVRMRAASLRRDVQSMHRVFLNEVKVNILPELGILIDHSNERRRIQMIYPEPWRR